MLAKGFSVPELQHPTLPGAVSWLPLPSGWIVLGAALAVGILIYAVMRGLRWRRNRWRREARRLLLQPHSVDEWLNLIKRIQLVHHPRPEISALHNPVQILAELPLDESLRQTLCGRYCQPENQLDERLHEKLQHQLGHWLEKLPDV